MPIMDGLTATTAIREYQASQGILNKVIIIGLTASHGPEEDLHCRKAGMDTVGEKPMKREMLQSWIKTYAPDALGQAPAPPPPVHLPPPELMTTQAPAHDFIEVPAHVPALAPAQPIEEADNSVSQVDKKYGVGFKVLVVEDTRVSQIAAQRLLTNEGCKVQVVENGKEAVSLMRDAPLFDIIFMDVNMPVMNGVAATKAIRAMAHRLQNRPYIIGLSASGGVSLEECIACGMDEVQQKPLKRHLLIQLFQNRTPFKASRAPPAAVPGQPAAAAARHPPPKEVTFAKTIGNSESSTSQETSENRSTNSDTSERSDSGEASSTAGEQNKHVLVVEDNTVSQKLMKLMLERDGWTVQTADNGQLAVDATAVTEFTCVLMDCDMPVKDGWQATREIRAREAGGSRARVPIIAVTANAMAGDRQICIDAGMDDYISKPVQRKPVLVAVKTWASKWARQNASIRRQARASASSASASSSSAANRRTRKSERVAPSNAPSSEGVVRSTSEGSEQVQPSAPPPRASQEVRRQSSVEARLFFRILIFSQCIALGLALCFPSGFLLRQVFQCTS